MFDIKVRYNMVSNTSNRWSRKKKRKNEGNNYYHEAECEKKISMRIFEESEEKHFQATILNGVYSFSRVSLLASC